MKVCHTPLYHPNALIITVNEVQEASSIRLHPGLNPEENAAFIEFLNELSDDIPDESGRFHQEDS